MNIFVLDDSHEMCAAAHADQHVGKMLLESVQLLCTAHTVPQDPRWPDMTPTQRLQADLLPYKHTHVNHKCAVWTRRRRDNYLWLVAHAYALADEWVHRYDKPHASRLALDWCAKNAAQALCFGRSGEMTPHAQAMPEHYQRPSALAAYRLYYAAEKRILDSEPATWARREVPEWFDIKYHVPSVVQL
jgi:hypothetical protein